MTKRVLFFTKIDFSAPATGGLFRKVKAQARALATHPDVEVDLFYIQGLEAVWERQNGEVIRRSFSNGRSRAWYTNIGVFSTIGDLNYQVIYIRHFLLNPIFVLHLRIWHNARLDRRILLELPTFPYRPEFRDAPLSVRLQVTLDHWTFRLLPSIIDRIVTFSRQLTIREITTIQTDNGVDPETMTAITQAPPTDPFRILGLANLNIWHGYDRMIRGMAEWAASNDPGLIHFDIAGTGKEEQNLRNLVKDLNVDHLVTFHGFLQGDELDQLIARCHVGLASLGMHRTGVADGQTTTLKAREFAARGLPFILGYTDHDFGPNYPFCRIEQANESPVDPESIRQFYAQVIEQDPQYFTSMRNDARNRLSWKAKLAPVLNYLDEELP